MVKLPLCIANMVCQVAVKPVLFNNIDDLSKAVSFLKESQLSLEQKQVSVRSEVCRLQFCRSIRVSNSK
ncbi:hypothetical protein C5167_026594 [Papaver somniferum]|nr:hypothetical protein C5167_026594 [Papaver somniferum]